jgi:hypothetical protein
MKAAHLARLERLDAIAQRYRADNKTYECFWMDNNKARIETWTQKDGKKCGEWMQFDNPRAAFEWVTSQLHRGGAVVYLEDVRDIMSDDNRAIFELMFPNAPGYEVMFNIREGQDFMAEALRLWRHSLRGVAHVDWWKATQAHIDGLLQAVE